MATKPTKNASDNNADSAVSCGNISHFYYFAYGADLNQAQVLSRGSRPVVVGAAKLADHRLAFFGYSRTWDGAMKTVLPEPGQEVWGVIYELTPGDWDRLDAWHDVRLDGTGTYFHFPARVTDSQGKTYSVLLYKKDILREPQLPSREYLDVILRGALEHGLPASYIEELQRQESKPAAFAVPREEKYNPELLLQTSCSACEDLPADQGSSSPNAPKK